MALQSNMALVPMRAAQNERHRRVFAETRTCGSSGKLPALREGSKYSSGRRGWRVLGAVPHYFQSSPQILFVCSLNQPSPRILPHTA